MFLPLGRRGDGKKRAKGSEGGGGGAGADTFNPWMILWTFLIIFGGIAVLGGLVCLCCQLHYLWESRQLQKWLAGDDKQSDKELALQKKLANKAKSHATSTDPTQLLSNNDGSNQPTVEIRNPPFRRTTSV